MTLSPPPSATALLVCLTPPAPRAAEAASVLAPLLGSAHADLALALRRSQGTLEVTTDLATAEGLAAALRGAGLPWYAVAPSLVPRPPKPLTARGLDPRGAESLLAPVAMTGAPEALAYRAVVAAVPFAWLVATSRTNAAAQAKGPSMAKVAMSLATTGGIGLLMARPGGGGAAPPAETSAERRAGLALLAVTGPGQWRRLHVFGDRCDYQVLEAPSADTARNWRALLAALAARLRPEQAGAALLAEAIAGRPAEDWGFDDDNALAERLRWLVLCAALRRMGARG